MDLAQYAISELESTRPVNESTSVYGKTDVFKGDKYCGPHHHDYVLWAPQIGWGKTGDALDDPEKGKICAGTHEHMIVDGKVLEAFGHTHKLLAGTNVLDTNPAPMQATKVVEVDD